MQLQTVDIPRAGAREAAADYMRHARATSDPDQAAELESIARAYRLAAQEGMQMIALTPTIRAGGTMQRTHKERWWTTPRRYLLPRLAAIRADSRYAYTGGVQRDGSLEFTDRLYARDNLTRGRLTFNPGFTLPDRFQAGERISHWTHSAWATMVPLVPPKARPRINIALREYLVLWEAEDWVWTEQKRRPVPTDPALLKHVGGDIYAVVATWDLTELERLVLADRRP